MKMFRVTFCCCGCTLRLGTLILLGISLILSVFGILGSLGNIDLVVFVVDISALIGSISGLIGVFRRLPSLLIPYLIYQWIEIVYFVYFLIRLLLLTDEKKIDFLKEQSPEAWEQAKNAKTEQELLQLAKTLIIFTEFVAILAIVLMIYFFIVVLSYYREMKENQQPAQQREAV